jgi:serine/threonine protein kinase
MTEAGLGRAYHPLSHALADRYRVERELGAGGMATVFLAHDVKHDRKVALKVLKPELAAVLGAERFVVEIKTTAALQHPHILPLFDSGTADGFLYYVMPFVDGETLRAKLDRETQLGVDEAVRITLDVAEALQYAHDKGVIHRDIKPENILLANGRPMVADFGIALAVSAAAGGRMTETGLSLGTPHYMSPEQATADKDITGRSDIYSLASVLYEMLTGDPPHTGASAQQIIMKIIAEPAQAVTRLRKSVPANVASAIARALEKLPADRFESARAFGEALKNPAFTSATASNAHRAPGGAAWKQRAAVPLVVTSLVLLAIAGRDVFRKEPPAPVSRFDLSIGDLVPLPSSDLLISPDGSTLAIVATQPADNAPAIYVRRLDGDPSFRKIAGTESANATPSFSPDSKWLAYRRINDGAIMRVEVSGGPPSIVAPIGTEIGSFVQWGTDSTMIYSGGPQGLFRLPASGGTPEFLPKTRGADRYSAQLPDGSGVLFSTALNGVKLYDFRTDSVTMLAPGAVHPSYVSSGHILYVAEGGLFALPFDLKRHRVTGPAVRVLERVAAAVGQRGYSVSASGTLVFHQGASNFTNSARVPNRLAIVDFAGKVEVLPLSRGTRAEPRFSPSGSALAYTFFTNRATDRDIYTFELASGTDTRLTFAGNNNDPFWSSDGKQILFVKRGEGDGIQLHTKLVDNSAAEQPLPKPRGLQRPLAWLADGTVLLTARGNSQTFDIFTWSPTAGIEPRPFLRGPYHENDVAISPDGKLAAFTSTEAGENGDVWLTDYPSGNGKWQISTTNGQAPRWSRDSKYVYYWKSIALGGDSLFRARVDRMPSVVVRPPEFITRVLFSRSARNWDLHPDGKRFVATIDVSPDTAAAAARYLAVLNWYTDLKARMAVGK